MHDINSLARELYENVRTEHRGLKKTTIMIMLLNILVLLLFEVVHLISYMLVQSNNTLIYKYIAFTEGVIIVPIITVLLISHYFRIIKKTKKSRIIFSKYIDELVNLKCKFEVALDTIPDPITLIDNEFRIVYVNKEKEKLMEQIGVKNYLTKSFLELVPREKNIELINACEQVMKLGIKKVIEDKYTLGDGTVEYYETKLYPISQGMLFIETDITEKTQIELALIENEIKYNETLESDKMRTEFFSNISHELRTPLNIILGALQLYDEYQRKNNENMFDYKKYFKIMKQNCNRLLRLINNIIDITKIDAGFYELDLKNYNIVSIVEETILSVADYIENKGVYIEFDTDIEELMMACDIDKIERIILNLMSNAIKHTNKNDKIFVNIKSNSAHIDISIRDTGEGIPEDKFEVIFERFRQVDRTLTRKNEGSGIGLSLVKSLVEMHSGTVEVKSKLGEGSEFIIKLPVKVCENSKACIENLYIRDNVERIKVEFSDIYKME